MTEYIVGYILKATYNLPSLDPKICTCGTIRGCTKIKINHENKVVCTQIVMHWATIRICATNRVNKVFNLADFVICQTAKINPIPNFHLIWSREYFYIEM